MNKQLVKKDYNRPVLTGLLLLGLAFPVIGNAQVNDAHHNDYLAALNVVAQGESRIAQAIMQVQSGQVAHYDFLQNEHIELIRHARALAWPPGSIAASDKDALRKDAAALLDSAESLEWVIADYLRAVAQVRSATSNTLDIAQQAAQQAAGSLKENLNSLQVATMMFMASAYEGGWTDLTQAYDAVFESDISEQTRRELQFQQERLSRFTPQLQIHINALLDSDVDQRAVQLKARYDAAT
tara:strand:+ start:371 stop:1090 length:720 start_codon:yes stop_codon:yes gene_type:complete